MANPRSGPRSRTRRAEAEAISVRPVLIAIAALFIVIATCAGLVTMMERHFRSSYARPGVLLEANGLPAVVGPAPQPAPQGDLAAFRAEKDAMLKGYGWVDRSHGVVRIPIDQAMRLLAKRSAVAAASP